MASLSAILILTLTHACTFAFISEPSTSWPSKYLYSAETYDLITGVVEPFQVWYSEPDNRIRVDYYDGLVREFIDLSDDFGSNYEEELLLSIMIYYSTDKDMNVNLTCGFNIAKKNLLPTLPDLEGFKTSGHEGRTVDILKKSSKQDRFKTEETMYIYRNDNGEIAPYKYILKKFVSSSGTLVAHRIIDYFAYNTTVDLKVMIPDNTLCDVEDAVKEKMVKKLKRRRYNSGNLELEFLRHKKRHNRNYVGKEHDMRKKIFEKNLRFIEKHNSKRRGYELALNEFADQTDEELLYLTGSLYKDPQPGSFPFPMTEDEVKTLVKTIPKKFDLREQGYISKVKNQARCGSCWSFALTATVEGALSRVNGGKNLDLSEQSLVDCAWGYGNYGCLGGFLDTAFQYVLENGIPLEEEYGDYLQKDGKCHVRNVTTHTIKGYVAVTPRSANALKVAVVKYGPVMVAIHVDKAMKFYSNGIFYDIECKDKRPNHAVTVVGYGVKDGDLYWIIKNSWGSKWGEDGYLMIAARNNNCGVLGSPYYAVV